MGGDIRGSCGLRGTFQNGLCDRMIGVGGSMACTMDCTKEYKTLYHCRSWP